MNKIIRSKFTETAGRMLIKNRINFQRYYSNGGGGGGDGNWRDDPKCNKSAQPCINIDDTMIKPIQPKPLTGPGTLVKKKLGCSSTKAKCQQNDTFMPKLCTPLPKFDSCPKIKLPGCRSLPDTTICKRVVTPEKCLAKPCPQPSFLACLKVKYPNVQLFRRGGCEVRNRTCAPYDVDYPEV